MSGLVRKLKDGWVDQSVWGSSSKRTRCSEAPAGAICSVQAHELNKLLEKKLNSATLKSSSKVKFHLRYSPSLSLHPSHPHKYHITLTHSNQRLRNTNCRSSLPLSAHLFDLFFPCHLIISISSHCLSPSLLPSLSYSHLSLLTSRPSSLPSLSQASNGQSADYSYSLPSTPVVSHREPRVLPGGEGGGSVNSRSLKNIPHRRPSLFKVSCCQLSWYHTFSSPVISRCRFVPGSPPALTLSVEIFRSLKHSLVTGFLSEPRFR